MSKRRKYSEEFKREAVQLANGHGMTVAQVGRDLGVDANMVSRWNKEMTERGELAFQGQGKTRDEEMMRLKWELARVKKKRDFLKEAAVSSSDDCTGRQPDEL